MKQYQRKVVKRQSAASRPLIIVFVGEKLSGKELAAQYLSKRHGFIGFRFSKILDDMLARLHLPISRVNEMHLAGALRERFGGGVLAEVIKRELEQHKVKRAIIDGLRHPAEYEALKNLPGLTLVYLTAPLNVRFSRARQRHDKHGESRFTLQDFKREEKLVTEIFIARLGHKAKVKLVNDSTLPKLYQQIEQLIVSPYLHEARGKKT